MSILLVFTTIWRYLSSPRCKSDPCCPAADFINPLFGWKWPTHTKISNSFKKTETWNSEFLLSISFSDELAPRVPGSLVFPLGLCRPPGCSHPLMKPVVKDILRSDPCVRERSLSAQPFRSQSQPILPRFQEFMRNLHFSFWWPCTGWHLWTDT